MEGIRKCACYMCTPRVDDYINKNQAVIDAFTAKYKRIGHGQGRVAFEHKGYVLKVPRDAYGVEQNKQEYKIYRRRGKSPDPEKPSFARCRLLGDILVMEKLECVADMRHLLPSWVDCIDSFQVGLDKKGRLCAYDYASDGW